MNKDNNVHVIFLERFIKELKKTRHIAYQINYKLFLQTLFQTIVKGGELAQAWGELAMYHFCVETTDLTYIMG